MNSTIRKKNILFDIVTIVERNGCTVKVLQPRIDSLDFWYTFLWRHQYTDYKLKV
jgi:hypothetical protein